jgi:6-phosphogluconolactonase (cycloisomerase 2 family)
MRGGGTVNIFSVDASGRLKGAGSVGGLAAPWDFTLEPTGKFLLVAHEGGIRTYRINEETGALTMTGNTGAGGPHYVGVMYPP